MSDNIDKVINFLDKVKVNPIEIEVQQAKLEPTTTFNIHNYNFTLSTWYLVLFTIFIIVSLMGIIYFVSFHKGSGTLSDSRYASQQVEIANQISNEEALIYKEKVHAVAKCENKHFNSVHAELRSLFSYWRYKELNKETYQKASKHLESRLCDTPTEK